MALSALLVWAWPAAHAHAADLLGIVETTLDRDATLAAARDAARAAQQAVPRARAGLLPSVQGGWGRSYNRIAMDDFPTTHYWQNGWTVALTQPLFDWSRWTAYRQADYVAARGTLQAASAMQDAILAASQAYFDVLAAEDELARASDYLHALDAHLALIQRAKAAGEATLVDVREGEASRAQAQLQRLDAQSQLRLARAALERLAGANAGALARLPAQASAPALQPADVEPWVTQAEAHGYAVQVADVALTIAKFDTEKARAGHFPSVDLQITHTPAGAGGGYSRPTTTTTGMAFVTIPVFSGGETTARVNEAKALEDKARDELEAAARDAAANARDGWLRVAMGRERVATLAQLVQRNETSLEATRIGFGAGSRTSTDILRATEALYASRRDAIRARYDAVLALLRLLAQTATLDLDEVARINTQLFAGGAARSEPPPVQTPVRMPVAPAKREAVVPRATAAAVGPVPTTQAVARAAPQVTAVPPVKQAPPVPLMTQAAPVPTVKQAPPVPTSAEILPAASAAPSTYAPIVP
ncbi:TolC family outer membrane protein [Paraburkholderia acidisoli]|uniref:TolC family outer membrane protein n=2 Tax=Paraburkholderia acidisoli TaxID=2571748 RepID=A0A7Z2GK46_9BURK|nr:TolC family outer membrane protein [Paraburkholderia acidisoli]